MRKTSMFPAPRQYYGRICLIIMALPFLFCIAFGQKSDSLISVFMKSESVAEVEAAKRGLPRNLQKVDLNLLVVAARLRADGVTRENVKAKAVNKKYSTDLIKVDVNGNLLVVLYGNDLDSRLVGAIGRLGGVVKHEAFEQNRIVCWIPFDMIEQLADMTNVLSIATVPQPWGFSGEYTTAGDGIHRADQARSSFGASGQRVTSGQGVKVGVISNGVYGYWQSQESGDLPSGTRFQVSNSAQFVSEGTAMSEIVYDLAPGADICFRGVGEDEEDLVESIRYLQEDKGCDIIVDDVSFPDEPAFEDGLAAQKVTEVVGGGVTYISAAGNVGVTTFDGLGVYEDQSTRWMVFQTDDGPEEYLMLSVPANSKLI
jgi:hypothetical protein